MPRLLLFRHADAERTPPGSTDHERALTKGGQKASAAVGEMMARHGEAPDLVLCSTSARTRETWEAAGSALSATPEVRYLRSIYEAGDYFDIMRAEGGNARTLLLIGHNPAMHETALLVAADLAGRDGARLREGFPKAALAAFDFDGAWAALRPRLMRLSAFLLPERR
jgi:phosphohistidine phosphatase